MKGAVTNPQGELDYRLQSDLMLARNYYAAS